MKYSEKTVQAGLDARNAAVHLGAKVAHWRQRNKMMELEPDMRTPAQKRIDDRKANRKEITNVG